MTVRLLDPPLHEFLPVSHFEAALAEAGEEGEAARRGALEPAQSPATSRRRTRCWGLRGDPARGHVRRRSMRCRRRRSSRPCSRSPGATRRTVEIMLPLIAYETRAASLRELVDAGGSERRSSGGPNRGEIGTMIELPGPAWSPSGSRPTPSSSASGPTTSPRPPSLSPRRCRGGFLPQYLSQGRVVA